MRVTADTTGWTAQIDQTKDDANGDEQMVFVSFFDMSKPTRTPGEKPPAVASEWLSFKNGTTNDEIVAAIQKRGKELRSHTEQREAQLKDVLGVDIPIPA